MVWECTPVLGFLGPPQEILADNPHSQPGQHCPGWSGVQGLDPGQGLPHQQESIRQPALGGPGIRCLLGQPLAMVSREPALQVSLGLSL